MLVNATEMLKKAKAGHYAVGQFNINNLEWTKAILQTAQELNSPVILGVSEGAGKYMTGYKTVVGMVNGMMEELNITVPVALHLDHGSYDGCLKCVEAGFSSIMFDGSHYPIDENVAKTKELVKIVAEHNMSLEAEVGSIGGEEDGVVGMGECADPEECKRVADLGINFLAAGIGNIHGKYPANWKGLDFDFFFQGVGKRDMWTQSSFVFPMMRDADVAIYANQVKYNVYDPANGIINISEDNDFPCLYPGNEAAGNVKGLAGQGGEHNYYPQTKYLVDMSYLRLKNITLGYTLPAEWTKKAYIEKLRLYASVDNLCLLHKGSGDLPVDPEMNAGQGGYGNGVWGRTYPVTRSWSFGLQLTF